jgi:hypothetical protein
MPQSGQPSRDVITNIGLHGMDVNQVFASENQYALKNPVISEVTAGRDKN